MTFALTTFAVCEIWMIGSVAITIRIGTLSYPLLAEILLRAGHP